MKHEVKCSSRTSCGPEALLSVLKLPPLDGGQRVPLTLPCLLLSGVAVLHTWLWQRDHISLCLLNLFSSAQGTAQRRGAFCRITRTHPRPVKSDFGSGNLASQGLQCLVKVGSYAFSVCLGASEPTFLFFPSWKTACVYQQPH